MRKTNETVGGAPGKRWLIVLLPFLLLLASGCGQPALPTAMATTGAAENGVSDGDAAASSTASTPTSTPPSLETAIAATPAATAPPSATPPLIKTAVAPVGAGPFPADGNERCGLLLPVTALALPPEVSTLNARQALDAVPAEAREAVRYILEEPDKVALVAYELGRPEEGIFLNADQPLPLASVVKIIHLVAYAEAVQAGILDPQMLVPLAELERYYLPNSDLSAHSDAVLALQQEGLVVDNPPSVRLETVPRMMMEFSSNAATDYLHMLLGQERIEQTIVDLGLTSHTAPCPFLGQFLLMGSGEQAEADVRALIADPERYSREVIQLTEAYRDENSSSAAAGWRGRWRRPSLATQQLFSNNLNTKASARDYATLMGRIAANEIDPVWQQNVLVRSYLEWPTHFATNQETLAWLGYKGGSLPGVLTAAYYAQPWEREQPVVVILFFHDLPLERYRQWRRTLPNDELARWLLYERDAIPTLQRIFRAP